MTITKTEKLEQFVASVSLTGPARVLGMHVSFVDVYTEGGTSRQVRGRTEPVNFAGLVALMHPDDQDALKLALDAAVGARP